MATRGAFLTRIRGVHRHILAPGPCCLVRKQGGELTPRRVLDALRETGVMRHPVDRQIFNGNHVEPGNNPTAVLMGEVTAPPGDALMDTGHDLAAAGAFGCPILFLAETPLNLCQRLLLGAEEARVGNLGACTERVLSVANVFSPTSMPTC
jgi:hypothetical protein